MTHTNIPSPTQSMIINYKFDVLPPESGRGPTNVRCFLDLACSVRTSDVSSVYKRGFVNLFIPHVEQMLWPDACARRCVSSSFVSFQMVWRSHVMGSYVSEGGRNTNHVQIWSQSVGGARQSPVTLQFTPNYIAAIDWYPWPEYGNDRPWSILQLLACSNQEVLICFDSRP